MFFQTEAVVSSGRVEKSPHEQEIKFFAKVRSLNRTICLFQNFVFYNSMYFVLFFTDPFAFGKPILQEPLPLLPVYTS